MRGGGGRCERKSECEKQRRVGKSGRERGNLIKRAITAVVGLQPSL